MEPSEDLRQLTGSSGRMSDALEILYWDACIFYEHCRDEPVDLLRKQAIDDCLADNKNKRNRICTSTITHIEVIPAKLGADGELRYLSFFDSLFFFDIPADRSIFALAREIKDFYYVERDDEAAGKMLSTGDAVQLATAIIHDVSAFYTRDGKRRGGNVPLIGLANRSPDGKICGKYALNIVDPIAPQGSLFDA